MKKYTNERTKVGLRMYRVLLVCTFILLILNMSCESQKAITDQQNNASVMELVLQDNYSGTEEEEQILIKNQKSLLQFFAKVNRTRKPGLPVPEIDFKKHMVLVWCVGETTNSNPGLILEKETEIEYKLRKLNAHNKTKSTAILSPFMLYKLPLNDKKIIVE